MPSGFSSSIIRSNGVCGDLYYKYVIGDEDGAKPCC